MLYGARLPSTMPTQVTQTAILDVKPFALPISGPCESMKEAAGSVTKLSHGKYLLLA